MTIKVGDKIPTGALHLKTADGVEEMSTDALFGGKKVVVFALPGAFTPTCSAKHLPGFVAKADEIAATTVFLASKEAGYITGGTLHVNGGMAML